MSEETSAETGGEGESLVSSGQNPAQAQDSAGKTQDPAGKTQNAPSWRDILANSLDENDRETFRNLTANHDSPEKFAKSYVETKRGFDKRVDIPDPSDPDARREFMQKHFGTPKDPSEYTFNRSEDAPPLTEFETQGQEEFRQVAHQIGLTQDQMDALVKWNDNFRTTGMQAMKDTAQQMRQTTEQELKRRWGPDYEAKLADASETLNRYLGDKAGDLAYLQLADGGVLGSHPLFVEMTAEIGSQLGEDHRVAALEASGQMDDLNEQIAKIKQKALSEGKSPAAPEVVREIEALRKKHGYKAKTLSPISGMFGR